MTDSTVHRDGEHLIIESAEPIDVPGFPLQGTRHAIRLSRGDVRAYHRISRLADFYAHLRTHLDTERAEDDGPSAVRSSHG